MLIKQIYSILQIDQIKKKTKIGRGRKKNRLRKIAEETKFK